MNNFFPPEWYPQDAIQLVWPHRHSDWASDLSEVESCYLNLAKLILRHQPLIIATYPGVNLSEYFTIKELESIRFVEVPTNDTWVRDFGPITVFENSVPKLLNFKFNGWGNKFEADLDNNFTNQLKGKGVYKAVLEDNSDFVFEGGAIETNGKGVGITTARCIYNANRNPNLSDEEIFAKIKEHFFLEELIVLSHGELFGDDTDAHIDTLVRFVNEDTLAYVKCYDQRDDHLYTLTKLELELEEISKRFNLRIVPIPHALPAYGGLDRLPATYLNFLITNKAVFVPLYNTSLDKRVLQLYKGLFKDRKVVGVNCEALIRQNGSLHCATMHYPKGVLSD